MTTPADYAERIMAAIDGIEQQSDFKRTLKLLCCIVGWYARMNCDPLDFKEASDEIAAHILEAMVKDEEVLSQIGEVH